MRMVMAAGLMLAALGMGGTAQAQTALEARVDRLEREMRAVQRKVFPGGAGQTLEPQITPQPVQNVPGLPASNPVTDLTQRVTALEGQVATLTGQVEQAQYRLRQVEDAFAAYKRTTDARLKALEDTATTVGPRAGVDGPAVPAAGPRPAAPRPAGPKPDPARAEAVAAIEKPESGDPAEDGYVYGYRLWAAKLYPEAETQLKAVATKYPKHRRASWAQNLLGRAYLDEGKPSDAAIALYNNYKTNPTGERAPDSLYYLAQALVQLKKPAAEVCKVYDELLSMYADKISPELRARVDEGRSKSKCR
ncbi:MAG: hypothetical protein ACOY45_05295 [Pseudomonadota bacterium]